MPTSVLFGQNTVCSVSNNDWICRSLTLAPSPCAD
jgi:hypothetical protein